MGCRTMTVDHEARVGANYQGRPHTPESRTKMSESAKKAILTKKRATIDRMNRRANRTKRKP